MRIHLELEHSDDERIAGLGALDVERAGQRIVAFHH
jgi:hypothetical protein